MTKRERENTTARLFSTTGRLRLTAMGAVNFAFSTSTSLLIPLRQGKAKQGKAGRGGLGLWISLF